MPEYLTFALVAPLAAMGELAVGERRSSWDRPGRSAILGLIAACLGLDREDEAAHHALRSGYGLAMRIETVGPMLADYHTAQVPPRQRGRHFATRAEELAADTLETILSRRDYRSDTAVLVAAWQRGTPRWSLGDLAAALMAPVFVPYFGRKSCPLSLPMAPRLGEASDPVAALAARAGAGPEKSFITRRSASTRPMVVIDAADVPPNLEPLRIEFRRDDPLSRHRWQFGLREEAVIDAAALL